jgi:hypothetical protein
VKPERCPVCPSREMLVGEAATQQGRPIFPYYCSECGAVTCQYANQKEIADFRWAHGKLKRVYTSTEQKILRGERTRQTSSEVGPCEVCSSTAQVEIHHWAPYHLFGAEAEKWPVAKLCRRCHLRWHKIVTPNMGAKKGEWGEKLEARKAERGPHP